MSLLDARLSAVMKLIPRGSVLLDVGTDHCKLPAEGVLSGHLLKAYASDIKEGPLNAARKQLGALGLFNQVELFLSAGLNEVPQEVLQEVDAVSVAGMGGEVMEVILKEAPIEPPLWVLQPMSAIYELLDFLANSGYEICSAALALEGQKLYRTYAVRKTGIAYEAEYFAMHRGDPLYETLLCREEKRVYTALEGLKAAKEPDSFRIDEAKSLLEKIRKAKG